MKYESSILKRLIDTYGVVGNPCYISEIIKEFIVRGKERFPELFTYQSDWLAHIDEFGLSSDYVVSYTGQSIYAPNTLERPVKRAILKGNTLVNIKGEETNEFKFDGRCHNDYILNPVKDNTKYLILYDLTTTDTIKIGLLKETSGKNVVWTDSTEYITSSNGKVILNSGTGGKFIRIISSENNSHVVNNLTIVEYQDGMENWDIPYFTGMQSVKMPGLTTTGKNLFDKTKIIDNKYQNCNVNTGNFNISTNQNYMITDYIKVFPNTTYTRTNFDIYGAYYDQNKQPIKTMSITSNTFTTPSNAHYVVLNFKKGIDDHENAQLELNTLSTSYEPYKSNILTVNEDVTLRSNGDICDELNLLTGQLTQRIGEDGVVLSQEVIKTVELTTLDQNGQNVKQLMSFNGGTHFTTTSQDGSLLPTLTVTVETDLEETLRVCSLDGNTM